MKTRKDTGSVRKSAAPGKKGFSWLEMAYLVIAMLAIGCASIYATNIINGDADEFDWIMGIALVLIGVSNAMQFFAYRRKRR